MDALEYSHCFSHTSASESELVSRSVESHHCPPIAEIFVPITTDSVASPVHLNNLSADVPSPPSLHRVTREETPTNRQDLQWKPRTHTPVWQSSGDGVTNRGEMTERTRSQLATSWIQSTEETATPGGSKCSTQHSASRQKRYRLVKRMAPPTDMPRPLTSSQRPGEDPYVTRAQELVTDHAMLPPIHRADLRNTVSRQRVPTMENSPINDQNRVAWSSVTMAKDPAHTLPSQGPDQRSAMKMFDKNVPKEEHVIKSEKDMTCEHFPNQISQQSTKKETVGQILPFSDQRKEVSRPTNPIAPNKAQLMSQIRSKNIQLKKIDDCAKPSSTSAGPGGLFAAIQAGVALKHVSPPPEGKNRNSRPPQQTNLFLAKLQERKKECLRHSKKGNGATDEW